MQFIANLQLALLVIILSQGSQFLPIVARCCNEIDSTPKKKKITERHAVHEIRTDHIFFLVAAHGNFALDCVCVTVEHNRPWPGKFVKNAKSINDQALFLLHQPECEAQDVRCEGTSQHNHQQHNKHPKAFARPGHSISFYNPLRRKNSAHRGLNHSKLSPSCSSPRRLK